MVDVGEATGVVTAAIPKLAGVGSGFVNMMAWFILLIVILVFFGVLIFILIRMMKFNKKLVFFEKIRGKWVKTRMERAAEIKFSTAGDTITYTLKSRKYIPNPSFQMGRREYWMAIRSDGELCNFELGDLDEEARQAGAVFLDKEARFARTQIQKGLKERYDKPSFWNQYGVMIMSMAWIAMIGVMTWLLFDKWLDLASATNSGVETAGEVLERVEDVLIGLNNICGGGSGIKSWIPFIK